MQTTTPEEVGFSSDRLRRLNKLMQGYVDDGKLSGIVTLLARNGEVFHHEAFGKMDLESGAQMDLDAIFRIYSMTKPISSAALMTLHEDGKFQLGDPVSAYIPELDDLTVCTGWGHTGPIIERQTNPITIQQLLSHTAGFSYGFFQDTPVDQMYRDVDILNRNTDLKAMVNQLAELPLAYQPGTQWRYSVATDVVGRLVEILSGQNFDNYLNGTIFEPLGMVDTGFYVSEEKLDRLASVYGPSDSGQIIPADSPLLGDFGAAPARLSGGGGLVSTAEDYARFCQMMVGGGSLNGTRILGPKTVDLMTTSHLPPEIESFSIDGKSGFTRGCGFGLGFCIVEDVASNGEAGSVGNHFWGGAASTVFWIDPVEDLYAILMAQFMPAGHYPIRSEFKTLVYQSLVE